MHVTSINELIRCQGEKAAFSDVDIFKAEHILLDGIGFDVQVVHTETAAFGLLDRLVQRQPQCSSRTNMEGVRASIVKYAAVQRASLAPAAYLEEPGRGVLVLALACVLHAIREEDKGVMVALLEPLRDKAEEAQAAVEAVTGSADARHEAIKQYKKRLKKAAVWGKK